MYFLEHIFTSIALIVRSLEQACAISEQFNNLFPARQVQIIQAILDKEKRYLYTMIKAMLERIDSNSQEQKSL